MDLFRRDVERRCGYCQQGSRIGEGEMMCPRRGIVPEDGRCFFFRYDPLKRTPPRPLRVDTKGLTPEDFSI